MLDYLEQNNDITGLSWFKTRAKTKYFFEIKESDDIFRLKEIYDYAVSENLKIIFIWSWTNVLFAFDNFPWIIIKNGFTWFEIKDDIIEINSWELVSRLSKELVEKFSKQFFYAWVALPWTIWWAVVWNAWCFWLEMKDIFISAKVINLDSGEIIELNKEQMNFGYRKSELKNQGKYFLISAKITAQSSLIIDENVVNDIRQKQPKWLSCGSFYRNPINNSAGKLIDEAGLKWFRIWWAFISTAHANFLMSDNSATYTDILQLNDKIKHEVFDKFWIKLEEEVVIFK